MLTLRKTILSLAALLAASAPLGLAQGTYIQIDVPGAIWTAVSGSNTAGDIVGCYAETGDLQHGFLLSSGVYTTIDAPGAEGYTFASGINDLGQIVGYSIGSTGVTGFLYDVQSKTFTTIVLPSQYGTYAVAINNAGTIVGYVYVRFAENVYVPVGFQLIGRTFNKVLPRGCSDSSLVAINNSGKVVGSAETTSGNIVDFLFKHGTFRPDIVPAPSASPNGINDLDAIVGEYQPSSGVYQGFLWQNRSFQSLMFPGATATFVYAVNNSAEVVGWFYDAANIGHGFTWTPPAAAEK